MNKNIKRIIIKENTNKTIIEDISAIEYKEYIVGKDAKLTLILLGKRMSFSSSITVRLHGEGASAHIIGCIIGDKKHALMLHTLQRHEASETTSNLLVKSVLFDEATFMYDGGIYVDTKAQKTDAYQRNENLLLSGNAHAQSKPRLEILANDVRCTHGATVSTVLPDHLWYLATRGVDCDQGTMLITHGFLEQAISSISDIIVEQKVRKLLWQTS